MKKTSKTNWKRVDALRDEDIDTSDIPVLDKAFFKNASVRMPTAKESVTIRLDHSVLSWFRHHGHRYQTLINAVLKAYVDAQSKRGVHSRCRF